MFEIVVQQLSTICKQMFPGGPLGRLVDPLGCQVQCLIKLETHRLHLKTFSEKHLMDYFKTPQKFWMYHHFEKFTIVHIFLILSFWTFEPESGKTFSGSVNTQIVKFWFVVFFKTSYLNKIKCRIVNFSKWWYIQNFLRVLK